MTSIRVGTCSWADDALVKYWYPKGVTAKERLAWYAEHFSTGEVDSTFYRVPDEQMVQGWANRTPPAPSTAKSSAAWISKGACIARRNSLGTMRRGVELRKQKKAVLF